MKLDEGWVMCQATCTSEQNMAKPNRTPYLAGKEGASKRLEIISSAAHMMLWRAGTSCRRCPNDGVGIPGEVEQVSGDEVDSRLAEAKKKNPA